MSPPFLSIIIPAYNEERRLPHSLEQIFTFLNSQDYSAEVLVIENGSSDSTFETVRKITKTYKNLRVFQEPQRGKGKAVRLGMLKAKGKYRFICDADLSMPIEEISKFLPPNLNDFDIAIASREAPGAVRINEPSYRHFTGRIFNAFIHWLVLPDLQDTQCGFKCFRGPIAEDLFRFQTLNGWTFDVEILFIARQRGYSIIEIPIHWYFKRETKISVIRDSWKMFLDLIAIRRNARRGVYGIKE
ncbi:MAG: glycosyltransferase family 2 protein [Anaerolineae bacterium]|nr:glycosyltransferase family 2 protein [Anaerolineae bacterium]